MQTTQKKSSPCTAFLTFFLCFLLALAPTSVMASSPYHFRFKNIPKHTWGDLKHSFWGYNGIFFLAGTGASLAFLPVDHDLSNHLQRDPVFSHDFDKGLGLAVSPYTLGGASLVAFLAGTQIQNPRFALASESAMEAWVGSMVIVSGAKLAIGRTRPNGGNYSMPSAHAAAAFAVATAYTDYYGLKAALPGYALASLVAFSRIDGGYHYLTDVLIGSVLGTTLGLGTAEFHKKNNAEFFVLPQVSSHETSLAFYKSF